jgi:two-component system chemotaxis response regulator CheB
MAFAQRNVAAGVTPGADPIKVMVVDDAVVIRGLLTRWLGEDKALKVVGSHRNGRLAVEDIEKSNPDVVVLDIEMPEMDGMTALPLMLAKEAGPGCHHGIDADATERGGQSQGTVFGCRRLRAKAGVDV